MYHLFMRAFLKVVFRSWNEEMTRSGNIQGLILHSLPSFFSRVKSKHGVQFLAFLLFSSFLRIETTSTGNTTFKRMQSEQIISKCRSFETEPCSIAGSYHKIISMTKRYARGSPKKVTSKSNL